MATESATPCRCRRLGMASTPEVAAALLLTAAERRGVTRLLRSALGDDRVHTEADVELLAATAWTRLHPAA